MKFLEWFGRPLFGRRKPKKVKLPEPTVEEKRKILLLANTGKHIILYKALTVQPIISKQLQYDYVSGNRYMADVVENHITSSETIEGTLIDADTTMVNVDNKWYIFGHNEPEKIYECNIIK
jgi:hypothetical protein